MGGGVGKESRGCVWRPGRRGGQGTRVWQLAVSESGEPHKPRTGSFKKDLVSGIENCRHIQESVEGERGPQRHDPWGLQWVSVNREVKAGIKLLGCEG